MDLVMTIENNLDSNLCKEIIEKYEADKRKYPGTTGGGYIPEMKTSSDLMISRFSDWESIEDKLDDMLRLNIKEYQKFIDSKFPHKENVSDVWHSGYQIQKSGHYKWHHDYMYEYGSARIITFIWYLNTIEEGGETDFHYKKVKPETGKFVMFPSVWSYPHCGQETKDKYIVTGWLWKGF